MEFDRQSLNSVNSGRHVFERPGSDIKMTGLLKKLKTMKKKFFVLRCTSSSGPARLEYYDTEKKFRSGNQAKWSIHLHTCFNINKKSDNRHGKYGIALYANEKCFTILTDTEKEQEAWLGMILEFQNEYLPDGDMHKEHYDHVWQVTLQPRGLGQGKGSKGQYWLCLNLTTVCLVKINSNVPQFSIQLVTIRTVAHHENSFRLEVGNYAPTGAGEFWFTVDDSNIVKDMHETLLQYMNAIVKDPGLRRDQRAVHSRSSREIHSQPIAFCPNSSVDAHSPGSPNYPIEYSGGGHRLRSDSKTSRTSKTSFHEDMSPGFITGYNGDHLDVVMREHCSVVPPDMSPPPSPSCLDDQMNAYLAMDMEKSKQRSSLTSIASTSTQSSTYFPMGIEPQGPSQRGELTSSHSDESLPPAYMPMAVPQKTTTSHPIPIHTHSFSEPLHSSHLPTVREGGSNEGYLPMDPSIPTSSSSMPRPEPAICMLSDNSSGLPPRTYSLGSKPTKSGSSYMDMSGQNKGAGNDMSRATSAPHILKGRKYREQRNESPTPSASPLSMSLKSDDSDSFIDYIPMRPRTASDSFNYRNRTSSFGKTQQTGRPRSSSHGQGTRPAINFSKLNVEKARISQEPSQRTSVESSLQGSFDSLRVSNESLRRMSQDMRQMSGSNASDYAEMRGTPSPQMKNMKSDPAGYVSMQVGTGGRRSSPHRVRTDSSGNGRHDVKSNSSDRLHQQTYLQQISDYTEMAPQSHGAGGNGDSYINMGFNSRHSSSSESKNLDSPPLVLASHSENPRYMNVDMDDKGTKSDGSRSLSMENVDTYVIFDPHNGNKPRTGSLGSKDKSVSRPMSTRKSSSASVSSASSPSSSGIVYSHNQSSVSTSARSGGSSDSIKKTSRQSSMEKYGSLGKEFRKKSGSTGSRPSTGKNVFGMNFGKDHHMGNSGRGSSSSKLRQDEIGNDEYVEFSPTATKGDGHPNHQVQSSVFSHSGASHSSMSNPSRSNSSLSSGSTSCARSITTPSPADDDVYTVYNPAARSVHFHQQDQQHHHPSQTRLGSSPSSAQARQIPAKEENEYVGFVPRASIPSSPNLSTHSFRTTRQVEAKDAPVYVGFEPGMKHVPPSTPNSQADYIGYNPCAPTQSNKYVGYDPCTPTQFRKPVTPTSAISYILNDDSSCKIGTDKPKQHHIPSVNPRLNEPGHSSMDNSQSLLAVADNTSNPELPGSTLSPSPSQISHCDTDEYLKYDPAKTSNSEMPPVKSTYQEKSNNSSTISQKPQLPQLYIDVGEESKISPLMAKSTNIGSSPREQSKPKLQKQLQRKLQQPPQNFLRQLSAPASQSSPGIKPLQESQNQPHSPQPLSPDHFNSSSRHKHLSSSSAQDSPSPTGSESRHKHWSGSSNSSQKSRRSSSDSERSFRKGLKPDSSTITAAGKKKFTNPGDLKSSEYFNDNNLQSPRSTDGMLMDISSLEAKIIPAEAKIRHSLGDVTSAVGKVSKESRDHHGLIRPDSTPCIQNLAPVADQGSRSVGDTPNSTPRSGSIQFSVGPRSRHSLSDLGTYQQMNFASTGLGPSSSESSNSSACRGYISGINENAIPEQAAKPLNYVKLDLGCPEGQNDADGKSNRIKSRNSSDADEKQPPLSYAEIDFVRSQCRSKTLPMGFSGDSSSSKS